MPEKNPYFGKFVQEVIESLQSGALVPYSIDYKKSYDMRGTVTMEFYSGYPRFDTQVDELRERMHSPMKLAAPTVERVIYNDPATVVYWGDGTKTVVICHDGDVYDERTGFLLCCAKKLFGNTGRYNDVMKANAPDTTRTCNLVKSLQDLFAGLGL